ncbi:hypothetical protein A7K84_28140, partial [Salmonella enterica]|nr:hypothetical protein [Salmonella enterica]
RIIILNHAYLKEGRSVSMLHIIFSYSPLTDIVIERPYNLKDIERWSKEAVHSLPQDFLFEYNIEGSVAKF